MNHKPVSATIKSKFDLGYILLLDNGLEAQLRVLELKGRELQLHVAGTEELIYGENILVYILHQDERGCLVSQFSPAERNEREQLDKLKENARNECKLGDTYLVEIEVVLEWGYLCNQVNGYLSGAIKKPTKELGVGQQVSVLVAAKNNNGNPYFELID
jgi:hypothetical protein